MDPGLDVLGADDASANFGTLGENRQSAATKPSIPSKAPNSFQTPDPGPSQDPKIPLSRSYVS